MGKKRRIVTKFDIRQNACLSNTLYNTTFIIEEVRSSIIRKVVLSIAKRIKKVSKRVIVIEGRRAPTISQIREEISIDRFYMENPHIKQEVEAMMKRL